MNSNAATDDGMSDRVASEPRHLAEQYRHAKRHLVRFLLWWACLFGVAGPFAVCPFCGQPGCGMGAGFAGILGGVGAALMVVPRALRSAWQERRSRRQPAEGKPC